MNAAEYDLIIDRAADYRFTLTVLNQSGVAVNLTGTTVYAQVRTAADKKLSATFAADLTNAVTGVLVLSLTEDDTLALNAAAAYEWDLFIVRTGSITERLLYGSVTVRQNVYKGSPIDPNP